MLSSVSWPSPIEGVCIRGWSFEADVSTEEVLEVVPDAPTGPSDSVGSKRWVESSLARRAAVDALRELGLPSDAVVATESGAPRFASSSMGVSIAHTHGLALAAVGSTAVGIDVEVADRDVSRLEAALLPGESDVSLSLGLLEVFVAKEAAAKATGLGLGGSMARWPLLDVELFGDHPRVTIGTPEGEFIEVRVWEHQGYVSALALVPGR